MQGEGSLPRKRNAAIWCLSRNRAWQVRRSLARIALWASSDEREIPVTSIYPYFDIRSSTEELIGTCFEIRSSTEELIGTYFDIRSFTEELIGIYYDIRSSTEELIGASFDIRSSVDKLNGTSFDISSSVDKLNGANFDIRSSAEEIIGICFRTPNTAEVLAGVGGEIRGGVSGWGINGFGPSSDECYTSNKKGILHRMPFLFYGLRL
ncbi:hypothetical protein [Acetobacteroides hydrogenigenes]|uniref:hypothetical protein n=1 Tax=Acetobacteroides hydrogenigenes TaxID=979970 RepID=UPI00104F54F9|nr:hypothetical protein [Acetobacteroides hydrogenigenes]